MSVLEIINGIIDRLLFGQLQIKFEGCVGPAQRKKEPASVPADFIDLGEDHEFTPEVLEG